MAGADLAAGSEAVLVIHSSGDAYALLPPSAQLVLGQYGVAGWNHGKRVYRRLRVGNRFHPEALLFYWDGRGGEDLAGWWIGSQIAGGEVWARSEASSPLPPESGWRCPVDGPPLACLRCAQAALPAPQAASADPPGAKRPRSAAPGEDAEETLLLVCRNRADLPSGYQRLFDEVSGEYAPQGLRQGRRTFLRRHGPGGSNRPVWLFFADGLWRLADALGSDRALGVARGGAVAPPAEGWEVPPGGRRSLELRLLPKSQLGRASARAEDSGEARLQRARAAAARAEAAADAAAEAAQRALLDDRAGAGAAAAEGAARRAIGGLRLRIGDVEAALRSLPAAWRRPGRLVKQEDPDADSQGAELADLAERLRAKLAGLQEVMSEAEQHLERLQWDAIAAFDCGDDDDDEDCAHEAPFAEPATEARAAEGDQDPA